MFGMGTPYRHPANNASRMSTDFTMKAPKPPDRPLVPYMRYSRKMWQKVRAENPEAQLWDIGKIIGQLWRDASDTEKQVYQQEFEMEKAEYEKAMKSYHSSQAYQHYVNAKNRAKTNEKVSRGRADMGGVVIQPVDEEDVANDLTSRRLAAVRFDRNHRLISEVFSPVIVNDARTIVAQTRIDMLRNQAKSLSNHQGKLEEELAKLEADYNDRKRIISKNSEDFVENLKKVCEEKPKLDEDKFNELINDWTGKLLEAYEDYKKKQEEISAKQAAEREKMEKETPVLAGLVMRDDEEEKSDKSDKSEKSENPEVSAAKEDEPMEQDNSIDSPAKSSPEEEQKVSSSTDETKKEEEGTKQETTPESAEKSSEKSNSEEAPAEDNTMEVDTPPADAPDSSEAQKETDAPAEPSNSTPEPTASVEITESKETDETKPVEDADEAKETKDASETKSTKESSEPAVAEETPKPDAEAKTEETKSESPENTDLTNKSTEESSPKTDSTEEKQNEKEAVVEDKSEEKVSEEQPPAEKSSEETPSEETPSEETPSKDSPAAAAAEEKKEEEEEKGKEKTPVEEVAEKKEDSKVEDSKVEEQEEDGEAKEKDEEVKESSSPKESVEEKS